MLLRDLFPKSRSEALQSGFLDEIYHGGRSQIVQLARNLPNQVLSDLLRLVRKYYYIPSAVAEKVLGANLSVLKRCALLFAIRQTEVGEIEYIMAEEVIFKLLGPMDLVWHLTSMRKGELNNLLGKAAVTMPREQLILSAMDPDSPVTAHIIVPSEAQAQEVVRRLGRYAGLLDRDLSDHSIDIRSILQDDEAMKRIGGWGWFDASRLALEFSQKFSDLVATKILLIKAYGDRLIIGLHPTYLEVLSRIRARTFRTDIEEIAARYGAKQKSGVQDSGVAHRSYHPEPSTIRLHVDPHELRIMGIALMAWMDNGVLGLTKDGSLRKSSLKRCLQIYGQPSGPILEEKRATDLLNSLAQLRRAILNATLQLTPRVNCSEDTLASESCKRFSLLDLSSRTMEIWGTKISGVPNRDVGKQALEAIQQFPIDTWIETADACKLLQAHMQLGADMNCTLSFLSQSSSALPSPDPSPDFLSSGSLLSDVTLKDLLIDAHLLLLQLDLAYDETKIRSRLLAVRYRPLTTSDGDLVTQGGCKSTDANKTELDPTQFKDLNPLAPKYPHSNNGWPKLRILSNGDIPLEPNLPGDFLFRAYSLFNLKNLHTLTIDAKLIQRCNDQGWSIEGLKNKLKEFIAGELPAVVEHLFQSKQKSCVPCSVALHCNLVYAPSALAAAEINRVFGDWIEHVFEERIFIIRDTNPQNIVARLKKSDLLGQVLIGPSGAQKLVELKDYQDYLSNRAFWN